MTEEEENPSGRPSGTKGPDRYEIDRRNLMKATGGTLVGATLFSQTAGANRQTIQAGETITGTIETSDDVDTYELLVDRADVIEVDFNKESRALTEFAASTDRTEIELGGRNSEGVEQLSDRRTIQKTDSLLINVSTDDGETTGQEYSFTITVEEGKDQWPATDRAEIQAGETVTGTVHTSDDVDTFELLVDRADVIEVDFNKESRALTEFSARTERTDIELGGRNSEGAEQLSDRRTIQKTDTLLINVSTDDGETTGQDYSFTVTVEEGKDQWPATDRAEIQAGETVTGTVHTSDDVDTFELLVDRADVIEVDFQKESRALTEFSARTERTDIELGGRNSEGVEQLSDRRTIQKTDTLLINVSTDDGETPGQEYSFTVTVEEGKDQWPATDRAEIQAGETITGTVHTSDDVDTFELLVDEGEVIDVEFEKESRALTEFAASTDRTEIELGGRDSEGTERFTASRAIEETGTLYINVSTDDGETPGQDYRFIINGELADETVSAGFIATPESPTVGEEVTFDGSETTANATIDSYNWTFGDGTTAAGKVVTHTYDTTGEYTVELTAATDNSSDTATATLTVGSDEHPSGVSQDVWDAVTNQNDPTSELTFQDLIDAIEGFQGDGTVNGVSVSFQDLIDLIEWFQGV